VNAASPAEVASDVTPDVSLLLTDLDVFADEDIEMIPVLAFPPFILRLVAE
jgi:hypothetical protein